MFNELSYLCFAKAHSQIVIQKIDNFQSLQFVANAASHMTTWFDSCSPPPSFLSSSISPSPIPLHPDLEHFHATQRVSPPRTR